MTGNRTVGRAISEPSGASRFGFRYRGQPVTVALSFGIVSGPVHLQQPDLGQFVYSIGHSRAPEPTVLRESLQAGPGLAVLSDAVPNHAVDQLAARREIGTAKNVTRQLDELHEAPRADC